MLRQVAAEVLGATGGKTALKLLHKLLGEDGWPSRVEALEVACKIGGHHATEAMVWAWSPSHTGSRSRRAIAPINPRSAPHRLTIDYRATTERPIRGCV